MTAFVIFSLIVYLLVWRIPRYGKHLTLTLIVFQALFYAYATIPTKSFYTRLVERNTGIEFVGNVNVRWGWASHPFGFPNIFADRAIDLVISTDDTNTGSVRADLNYSNSLCEIRSAKARSVFGGIPIGHCWRGLSSSGRDDIYLAVSKDSEWLYFWQR